MQTRRLAELYNRLFKKIKIQNQARQSHKNLK